VGTCLSYVTISWSSSPRSHSPRATSCRTDLIRACPGTERPVPVVSAFSKSRHSEGLGSGSPPAAGWFPGLGSVEVVPAGGALRGRPLGFQM
jgi:hypothetical protein